MFKSMIQTSSLLLLLVPLLQAAEQPKLLELLQKMANVTDDSGYSLFWSNVASNSALNTILSSGSGYTLFAPNNKAMQAAMKAFNGQYISETLFYHVGVPAVSAKQVTGGLLLDSKLSQSVHALLPSGVSQKLWLGPTESNGDDGRLRVFYGTPWPANAVQAGVQCSDGILYPIDAYLQPPSGFRLPLEQFGLEKFGKAFDRVGLTNDVAGRVGVTLFAPSAAVLADNGFDAMVDIDVINMLQYHTLGQLLYAQDLKDGQELVAMNGKKLAVVAKEGVLYVNGYKVVQPNILTKNGVLHVIEGILNPNPRLTFNLTQPALGDENGEEAAPPVPSGPNMGQLPKPSVPAGVNTIPVSGQQGGAGVENLGGAATPAWSSVASVAMSSASMLLLSLLASLI